MVGAGGTAGREEESGRGGRERWCEYQFQSWCTGGNESVYNVRGGGGAVGVSLVAMSIVVVVAVMGAVVVVMLVVAVVMAILMAAMMLFIYVCAGVRAIKIMTNV